MPSDHEHRRLDDFERYDRLTFAVESRWKTSDISGDEWRTAVRVDIGYKGRVIQTTTYADMTLALALLPAFFIEMAESGHYDEAMREAWALDQERCDQPGCVNVWTHKFAMEIRTTPRGEVLAPDPRKTVYYRQFCAAHAHRGDSSVEDCDKNYTLLEQREAPPAPREATVDEVIHEACATLVPVRNTLGALARQAPDGGRLRRVLEWATRGVAQVIKVCARQDGAPNHEEVPAMGPCVACGATTHHKDMEDDFRCPGPECNAPEAVEETDH